MGRRAAEKFSGMAGVERERALHNLRIIALKRAQAIHTPWTTEYLAGLFRPEDVAVARAARPVCIVNYPNTVYSLPGDLRASLTIAWDRYAVPLEGEVFGLDPATMQPVLDRVGEFYEIFEDYLVSCAVIRWLAADAKPAAARWLFPALQTLARIDCAPPRRLPPLPEDCGRMAPLLRRATTFAASGALVDHYSTQPTEVQGHGVSFFIPDHKPIKIGEVPLYGSLTITVG